MPIEIRMLAWAVLLGLVHMFCQATSATLERGLKWNASARDSTPPVRNPVTGRMDRAFRNFLETFPLFAAAVLSLAALDRFDAATAVGAQLYFWGRVAYLPLYGFGVPYIRSLAWAVSLAGLLVVWWGVF